MNLKTERFRPNWGIVASCACASGLKRPGPLPSGSHQNRERPLLSERPFLCGRRRSKRPGTIKEGGVELNDELATSVTAFRYYADDILLLQ